MYVHLEWRASVWGSTGRSHRVAQVVQVTSLCLCVLGAPSLRLAKEKLWQREQQDLSAESCYHKYLLYTLIAEENGSSSALSGSEVRHLITEKGRWHTNEQNLDATSSPACVLCPFSELYYGLSLLSNQGHKVCISQPINLIWCGCPPLRGTVYMFVVTLEALMLCKEKSALE